MKIFLFSKKDITSGVAKWGIKQSPYNRPEKLEVVIDKLDSLIDPLFEKDPYGKWLKLTYEEIKEFVFKYTTAIPEFVEWNNPRIDAGEGFIASSSRYHTTKPDYDYIDLHALARNVANDILFDSEGAKHSIPLILGQQEAKERV
jgi:hypothetical protein